MELAFWLFMRRAVELDDELGRDANEIGDIRTDWHLSSEFPSETAIS